MARIITFEQFRKLIVGRTIENVVQGGSLENDLFGIERIELDNGIAFELWGAADCVMVDDVTIDGRSLELILRENDSD